MNIKTSSIVLLPKKSLYHYRYSLGLTYAPNSNWTFRVGTAYDTSAVADEQHRTPRIPDGDRIRAVFGIGYKFSKTVSFDLGYAHLFINDPKINTLPFRNSLL